MTISPRDVLDAIAVSIGREYVNRASYFMLMEGAQGHGRMWSDRWEAAWRIVWIRSLDEDAQR